ncbi:MAG TPA: acetyl-CoA hydrolase, partial [Propionibacteriaceae bacterium]|nr:acetyl-CoA hydrolase [Propionibacteriaceae bacterium]
MRIIPLTGLAKVLTGIPAVPRVVAPGSFATPHELLNALDAALDRWRLVMVNALPGIPDREGILYESAFVGPGMRGAKALDYYPSRLSMVPRLFWTTLPPDIVVLHTSRPQGGFVSMGIEVQVMPGALEAARARGALILAQVNPHMPFTLGDGVISVDDIDVAVEVDQ